MKLPSAVIPLPSVADVKAAVLPVERRYRCKINGVTVVYVYRYPDEDAAVSHLREEARVLAEAPKPPPTPVPRWLKRRR